MKKKVYVVTESYNAGLFDESNYSDAYIGVKCSSEAALKLIKRHQKALEAEGDLNTDSSSSTTEENGIIYVTRENFKWKIFCESIKMV